MATESAPKHLRLLRPYVLLSLVLGATGTTVGFWLLERTQWSGAGVVWPWRQFHAQLQVFGFLVPFVTGFAVYLVPRVAGGRPIRRRALARLSLGAQALTGAMVCAAALWPGESLPRRIAAVAAVVGIGLAAVALRGPISEHAAHLGGRARVGYLWLLELSMWFLAAAGVSDGLALWFAAPGTLLDFGWAAAAYRFGIEGFAVGMALAISARMFTGFLGIDPGRAYPAPHSRYQRNGVDAAMFWTATFAWAGSVTAGAAGAVLGHNALVWAGDLLFGAGAIPFAFRLGLAPIQKELAIDRTQDPHFALGARGAYALLVLGALVGVIAAVAQVSGAEVAPIWVDARRHAITIGFLLALIATMGGRLAPGYAGRRLWSPGLRLTAIIAFVSSGLMRACEGIAAQWEAAVFLRLSAASGVVALAGFAALLASVAVTLLRARTAH